MSSIESLAREKCESYTTGTCAGEPSLSAEAPYLADRFCWPCRIRAALAPAHEPPDDSEADEAIAGSRTLAEALFEIATKYQVPLTNNLPRWQDGVYLREAAEFITELEDAFSRFPVVTHMEKRRRSQRPEDS